MRCETEYTHSGLVWYHDNEPPKGTVPGSMNNPIYSFYVDRIQSRGNEPEVGLAGGHILYCG
jgi:hypothetical protein